MFSREKGSAAEFWIATDQVVSPAQSGYYSKLEETLEVLGLPRRFARCVPAAYDRVGWADGH